MPRRILERALRPQPPSPPAPAGSVRCWRRAGIPRAVVRVCKEKCAIPDLEESVALNSLVPYDMKHTIRVCGKNASKRYPALCVQNKITIHRREETCIPSNRGIQRQAPTTIALPLSCSLRSLPHNGGLQGRFGEGGGKGKGEVGPESTIGHTGYGLCGHDLPFHVWGMVKQNLLLLAPFSSDTDPSELP